MRKAPIFWMPAVCLIGFPLIATAQEDLEIDGPFFLGTILIDGAKRTQDAQTFPGTVIQVDAEALDARAVRRINDLDRVFPGVAIDAQSARSFTNISVRGASSLDFYNPSVQVYVDGVLQDAGSLGQGLSGDIDTVELLYGPQGTLYGRGAIGGVLNITTLQPGEGPQFSFELEGGDGQSGAAVKGEVEFQPGLWADVALRYHEEADDLTQTDAEDVGGASLGNGRVRLRYAPEGSPWDVTVSVQRDEITSTEEYFVSEDDLESRTVLPYPSEYDQDTNTFALAAEYDLGWGKVTSVTSYQDRTLDRTIFGNFTPENQQTTTHELRLSSDSRENLSYVVGLFLQQSDFEREAFGTTVNIETLNAGVFGDLSWEANDRLTVSPGFRLDYERSEASASGYGVVSDGDDSWTSFSPKLGASYAVSEELQAYSLISTGFKAGGFTRTATTSNVSFSYDPQRTYNVESGLKYASQDGRINASLGAYYSRTDDYQMYVGTLPFQYLQNVGEVESKGIEAQVNYQENGWGVTLGAAYNKSSFTDYNNPLDASEDYTGNRVPYAPEVTLSVLLSHEFELGRGYGAITPRVGVSYQTDVEFDAANTIGQDAYTLVDAGVTWRADNGLEVDFYVTNLTDETYAEYGFDFGATGDVFTLGSGREIGVVLRHSL